MTAAFHPSPSPALRLIHLAAGEPVAKLFTPTFHRALEQIGDFTLVPHASRLPADEVLALLRSADVVLTGWGALELPAALAENPGQVRYLCHLTGTLQGYIPRTFVESGLPITNWGDSPAPSVAEAAITLLLASLKNIPDHLLTRREGQWWPASRPLTGTLRDLRVGLYGYGVIGRTFHNFLRPFNARPVFFDPFVKDHPADIRRVASLDTLFAESDAVCIHAALTPQTRLSVNAARLALLPDHAIVVNTARGDIIDQPALFREIEAGRLRAALDVLAEPDTIPPEHPARRWPNLILTGHQLCDRFWPDPDRLQIHHEVALENLRRFVSGQPLLHRMDAARYALST